MYIGHLMHENGFQTACGASWQSWQAPIGLTLKDPQATVDPPCKQPIPHIDIVKFCGTCNRLVYY